MTLSPYETKSRPSAEWCRFQAGHLNHRRRGGLNLHQRRSEIIKSIQRWQLHLHCSLVDRHFCCQAVPLTFLVFQWVLLLLFSSGYLLYLLNSTMNHFLKKKYSGLFCPFTFFSEIQRVCSVKTQYQLKIFIQVHSKISIHTYVAQKRFRFYFSIVSSDD